MSAKHTYGPLRITADADDWSANHEGRGISCYCGIRDASGTVVALAVAQSPNYHDDPDCRAIAERIVQCVNAHDELVALLKETLRPGAYGIGSTLAARIEATITKAGVA